MSTPRRFFLKSGSMAALAAVVAVQGVPALFGQKRRERRGLELEIPIEAQQQPTFMFTAATFQPYVGGYFQAPTASGSMITLKLESVGIYRLNPRTRLIRMRSSRNFDSFSLMFSAEARLPRFTSIHNVSHPALGNFDLFLSERWVRGQFFYEAVFNHVRS